MSKSHSPKPISSSRESRWHTPSLFMFKRIVLLNDGPRHRGISLSAVIRGPCLFVASLHPASSLLLLLFFSRPSFLPFLECFHTFLRLKTHPFSHAKLANRVELDHVNASAIIAPELFSQMIVIATYAAPVLRVGNAPAVAPLSSPARASVKEGRPGIAFSLGGLRQHSVIFLSMTSST
jgi:hypothetical protein